MSGNDLGREGTSPALGLVNRLFRFCLNRAVSVPRIGRIRSPKGGYSPCHAPKVMCLACATGGLRLKHLTCPQALCPQAKCPMPIKRGTGQMWRILEGFNSWRSAVVSRSTQIASHQASATCPVTICAPVPLLLRDDYLTWPQRSWLGGSLLPRRFHFHLGREF